MSQFIDIGNPLNTPRERLILNVSTIKSFSIISRMNSDVSNWSLPESDSEFFLVVTLKNDEEYLVELDGLLDQDEDQLYQPDEPDRIMDEFLSTLVKEFQDQLDIKSIQD